MLNKYEDWCYVCGEVVEEEKGFAEMRPHGLAPVRWGKTEWSVRHKDCRKPTAEEDAAEIEKRRKSKEAGRQ